MESRLGLSGACGRRLPLAARPRCAGAAWAWVTCAQPPPCPTGCPLGALQISCRPRWSSPKLSFSFFSPPAPYPDCPCPVSRHALPLPLSPLRPTLPRQRWVEPQPRAGTSLPCGLWVCQKWVRLAQGQDLFTQQSVVSLVLCIPPVLYSAFRTRGRG